MTTTYTAPEIYNAAKLALFSKACYLKKKGLENQKYTKAQYAIDIWLGQTEGTAGYWKAIENECGIDKNGVSSSWNGFQASAFVNEETKEIVIAYSP